jgi:hypothetical protein
MPPNNLAVAIDQNRDIETEGLDTVGDLPDLLLAVAPRVRWIRFELVDCPEDNRHRRHPFFLLPQCTG